MTKKFVNGTSIIFVLRKTMVSLGFLDDCYDGWINHKEFYHGLKKYYGENICRREYNGK